MAIFIACFQTYFHISSFDCLTLQMSHLLKKAGERIRFQPPGAINFTEIADKTIKIQFCRANFIARSSNVPRREAEVYLPRQRESPRLRWQTLWRTARPPETSPAWRRLGLFEAVPPEEGRCHATFFAGGAIWAGDWCPTPPRSQDGTPTPVPQWVALACCPDPEVEHPLSDIGSEVGLLQVWGLGPLQGHRWGPYPVGTHDVQNRWNIGCTLPAVESDFIAVIY